MSAAAAPAATAAAPAPKSKKKLIIIVAAVVLLLGIGGGAVVVMKKKAADAAAAAAEADGGDSEAAAAPKKAHKAKEKSEAPPTFVPLDPFVVNLADRDADRYAQIGVTLEVDDAKFAEEMKAYMPAIRNGVLMVIASKTSKQLLDREGKEALARQIMREAVRPMGIELDDEDDDDTAAGTADAPKPKKKKKHHAAVENPVRSVNFSSFIVQ